MSHRANETQTHTKMALSLPICFEFFFVFNETSSVSYGIMLCYTSILVLQCVEYTCLMCVWIDNSIFRQKVGIIALYCTKAKSHLFMPITNEFDWNFYDNWADGEREHLVNGVTKRKGASEIGQEKSKLEIAIDGWGFDHIKMSGVCLRRLIDHIFHSIHKLLHVIFTGIFALQPTVPSYFVVLKRHISCFNAITQILARQIEANQNESGAKLIINWYDVSIVHYCCEKNRMCLE